MVLQHLPQCWAKNKITFSECSKEMLPYSKSRQHPTSFQLFFFTRMGLWKVKQFSAFSVLSWIHLVRLLITTTKLLLLWSTLTSVVPHPRVPLKTLSSLCNLQLVLRKMFIFFLGSEPTNTSSYFRPLHPCHFMTQTYSVSLCLSFLYLFSPPWIPEAFFFSSSNLTHILGTLRILSVSWKILRGRNPRCVAEFKIGADDIEMQSRITFLDGGVQKGEQGWAAA